MQTASWKEVKHYYDPNAKVYRRNIKNNRNTITPQRGRRHAIAIVSCVSSKIQIRQWFVANYSNISCLATTVHTEVFAIFSLDLNLASCMPSSPFIITSSKMYSMHIWCQAWTYVCTCTYYTLYTCIANWLPYIHTFTSVLYLREIPYRGKLSNYRRSVGSEHFMEKAFAGCWTNCIGGCNTPKISWKFSPSKVFRYVMMILFVNLLIANVGKTCNM